MGLEGWMSKLNEANNKSKWLIQGGIFLAIFTFTIFYVMKNTSITQIKEAIAGSQPIYLAMAVCAMVVYFICEGKNIISGLKLLGYEKGGFEGVKYALIGFFFSSVTPSASGGQPMQLYQMHRDGIAVAHGTAALILEFISFQTMTVLLAMIGFVLQWDTISAAMGKQVVLLFAGVLVNLFIAIVLVIILFWPKVSGWLLKVKWIADKFGEDIVEYQRSAQLMKEQKGKMIPYFITTAVRMLAMYSVPYFVYLSMGLNTYSWVEVTALQAVLFVSVSALPIPGAMGISESGFTKLFQMLFPLHLLDGAMVMSRGISFYLFVLVSGICSGLIFLVGGNKRKVMEFTISI